MRLFRHITAEYRCATCHRGRSVIDLAYSPFDAIAIAVATVPMLVVAMRRPWGFPWYCVFPIMAGEALAVIVAGMVTGMAFSLLGGRNGCGDCGGAMVLAGRHFDPAGSRYPHTMDLVAAGVFVGLNGLFWLAVVPTVWPH